MLVEGRVRRTGGVEDVVMELIKEGLLPKILII